MGNIRSEVEQAVQAEMQLIARHLQEVRDARMNTGYTHDEWFRDAVDWYADRTWRKKAANMALTAKEATDVLAAALLGQRLDRDVRAIAVDIEDDLHRMEYAIVHRD